MKAVRFDEYGDVDVLTVADVPVPDPGAGQVLVRVRAAGINPGEAKIREGLLRDVVNTFLAGGAAPGLRRRPGGPGVTTAAAGDYVIGWVDIRPPGRVRRGRRDNLASKPADVPWEVAGGVGVAGFTAWWAVRAVNLKTGDTVAVSGAAGGVGSLTVQLARRIGATVVGIAGQHNQQWLREHGAIPVLYGEDLVGRIFDALLTTPAGGRVHRHLRRRLRGVRDQRARRRAVPRRHDRPLRRGAGVRRQVRGQRRQRQRLRPSRSSPGSSPPASSVPIAATYPLDQVREATHAGWPRATSGGKIVLLL
jgi:hypothetical protein